MEARRCGRPTKSGKPCQAILSHRRERACGRHATSEDQAYAQGWTDGEAVGRQGWQDAKETAKSEVRWEIENQIRREKAAEERRNFRTEVGGKRIVSVDIGGSRPFAYTWGGDPLAVGDRVLLRATGYTGTRSRARSSRWLAATRTLWWTSCASSASRAVPRGTRLRTARAAPHSPVLPAHCKRRTAFWE